MSSMATQAPQALDAGLAQACSSRTSSIPASPLALQDGQSSSSAASATTTAYEETVSTAPSSVVPAPRWWSRLSFGGRGGGTNTTLASATGATSRAEPGAPAAAAGPSGGPAARPASNLSSPPKSPAPDRASNVAEARAALEASMANILDRDLVPRARALHRGDQVVKKQQADVAQATASLRQANRQLEDVVNDVSWKLKEVGDLQNWTELLEQRFLAVEETLRLVREGDDGDEDGDEDASSCSSCRCSDCCSDCGNVDELPRRSSELPASATTPGPAPECPPRA